LKKIVSTVNILTLTNKKEVFVSVNCFEKYAQSFSIEFVHDTDANALIVEDVGDANLTDFVSLIKQYGLEQNIAKISVKVKECNAVYFFAHGFKVEASILAYYGLQDAFYIAYYLQESYLENQFEAKHNAILNAPYSNLANNIHNHSKDHHIKISSGISQPSIHGEQQLVFTGREVTQPKKNVRNKFFAQMGSKIIATVNAYHCKNKKVVEFSEFTVNLEFNPTKVINQLLNEMASYYASLDCKTAYTIVPASSLMINALCVENDFEFGGRLTNESVFKGKLDSLNTWFKQL